MGPSADKRLQGLDLHVCARGPSLNPYAYTASKRLPSTEPFSQPLISLRQLPGEVELGELGSGLTVELPSDLVPLGSAEMSPEDERLNHLIGFIRWLNFYRDCMENRN